MSLFTRFSLGKFSSRILLRVKEFTFRKSDRRNNLEELNISFNILLDAVMARGRFNMIGRGD